MEIATHELRKNSNRKYLSGGFYMPSPSSRHLLIFAHFVPTTTLCVGYKYHLRHRGSNDSPKVMGQKAKSQDSDLGIWLQALLPLGEVGNKGHPCLEFQ